MKKMILLATVLGLFGVAGLKAATKKQKAEYLSVEGKKVGGLVRSADDIQKDINDYTEDVRRLTNENNKLQSQLQQPQDNPDDEAPAPKPTSSEVKAQDKMDRNKEEIDSYKGKLKHLQEELKAKNKTIVLDRYEMGTVEK